MTLAAGKVVRVDPRWDDRWRELVLSASGGPFVSPPWIRALCATYGFTPMARLALDAEDNPVAGLAWIPVSDARGRRVCSLPFSDWADPIMADASTWNALTDDLLAPGERFSVRCSKDSVPFEDTRLEVVDEAVRHGCRLDVPVPDLYERIGAAARRSVTRSERRGVRVEIDAGLHGVRQFHRLQVALRKVKFRMLAQPVEFYERIWEAFTPEQAVTTMLAYLPGGTEPVAGVVFLRWNDVLYAKFMASLPGSLDDRPNDALYWAGIRWAAQQGLRMVDWGISGLDQPGLQRFKRKYSTHESRVVTLRSRGEASPAEIEVGSTLNAITLLLTEDSVPDEVTARAGAMLYHYFC